MDVFFHNKNEDKNPLISCEFFLLNRPRWSFFEFMFNFAATQIPYKKP